MARFWAPKGGRNFAGFIAHGQSAFGEPRRSRLRGGAGRDAPSFDIVPALTNAGAKVQAYDPKGTREAKKFLAGLTYCDGPYQVAHDADAIAILTEWDQFRAPDFERIKTTMRTPVVIDLQNTYNPAELRSKGFACASIGRA